MPWGASDIRHGLHRCGATDVINATEAQLNSLRELLTPVLDHPFWPEYCASLQFEAGINGIGERMRWDALWIAQHKAKQPEFIIRLYKSGLDDAHIDTMLREIFNERLTREIA